MSAWTKDELAALLALARNDLIAYTLLVSPWYKVGDMHHLLADELMRFEAAVDARQGPRLIIECPPRHGKTELASRHFPAWSLGRRPDWEMIFSTYAQDFSEDHSRVVRNLLIDPTHQAIFPGVALAEDSQSVKRFEVSGPGSAKRGVYAAVGVGGPATGRGARMLLIDDPIKNREEADSDVVRRKLHAWYDSVARTRVMPGGGVCITATRWHERDLTGYVLDQYAHEGWKVIKLPAVAESAEDALGRTPGEPLWPEQWPLAELEKLRQGLPTREWASLYQQRPAPDSGGYFATDKIGRYGVAPPGLVVIGASDYAVTEDGGDYTEHGIIGIDHESRWYLLDWWFGQTQSDVWIERQLDLVEKWKPAVWFGESGPIRRAVEPFLHRRMAQRSVACWLEWLPSINDKPTRARSLQALIAMGWLSVPDRPWVPRLMDQLLPFPAGVYDDGVDVLSLAARGMDKFGKGLKPEAAAPTPPPPSLGRLPARVLDAPEARAVSRYKA